MVPEDIRRIGVVGAGLMGHGIAQIFASAGYDVDLYDVDAATLEAAPGRIAANFRPFIELGLATPQDVARCLSRVNLCRTLADLCRGTQVIIEAILEDFALKKSTFAEIERYAAAQTLLTSNTSAISITQISEVLKEKGRFMGTHFWNPPQVIPNVEVIKGRHTEDGAFETVYALMEKVGKVPVRVLKDVPGFLGNRLQHAMWREAISLCEKGIASAEDIDKVVKYGFGVRMPFIGPLETADLAGLKLTEDIHRYLFPYLENAQTASPLVSKLVAEGHTGVKSGKGFYDWPPEKVQPLIQRRDTVLLNILRYVTGPTDAERK
jgi:3-hydroxybutyryl-CoA dehydrogenase